jgi:hypothetical protein
MKQKNSISENRIWVIVNYASLVAALVFFYTGRYYQWSVTFISLTSVFATLFVISFIQAFIKTRFWKMVHTSYNNLDEREKQVVLNSLRYSYSIFAILCIVIMYVFAVVNIRPFDVLLAATMLYLAHTLPGAIVGWREKPINDGNE